MATLPATKQFTDRVNRIEISATMAVVAEAAKLKACRSRSGGIRRR